MGAEGYHFEGDDPAPHTSEQRAMLTGCPDASLSIEAPNGAVIATLHISGASSNVSLVKHANVIGALGTITFTLKPENLLFGETFTRPRVEVSCRPIVDGAQPREWKYPVDVSFDGEHLIAQIGTNSVSLRNENLADPINVLTSAEELLLVAPEKTLTLKVGRKEPVVRVPLICAFRLRDFVPVGPGLLGK